MASNLHRTRHVRCPPHENCPFVSLDQWKGDEFGGEHILTQTKRVFAAIANGDGLLALKVCVFEGAVSPGDFDFEGIIIRPVSRTPLGWESLICQVRCVLLCWWLLRWLGLLRWWLWLLIGRPLRCTDLIHRCRMDCRCRLWCL